MYEYAYYQDNRSVYTVIVFESLSNDDVCSWSPRDSLDFCYYV